jgi:hypothetical protein
LLAQITSARVMPISFSIGSSRAIRC